MRIQWLSLLRLAALSIASCAVPLFAGSLALLELEPEDEGTNGSLDLHGWLTAPEPITGLELSLRFQTSTVSQVSIGLPDELKGPGLAAHAESTAEGAAANIVFDPAHVPAVGERVKAFRLRLCLESPTPIAGWDFSLDVTRFVVSTAGSASPDDGVATVPPIKILWGSNLQREQVACFDQPPDPEFVTCVTQPDGKVLITWSNPVPYEQITIYTTRSYFLPGDATSWVQEEDGAGNNYVYLVAGSRTTQGVTRFSEGVACAADDPREPVKFIRGDANQDGFLSTADVVSMARWAYLGTLPPSCTDSLDTDDDGIYSVVDQFAITYYLFRMGFNEGSPSQGGGEQPRAPFPEPGADPTHAGERNYMGCSSFEIHAPEQTDDLVRVGDVEANAGGEAFISVYVSNTRPVEALQLVIHYDPSVLRVLPGGSTISYAGTYFEPFLGKWFTYSDEHQTSNFIYGGPVISHVDVHEEDGILTAAIVGHVFFPHLFEIKPGEDTLVAKIRVEVSPDVPAGTQIHVDPVNGSGGQGYGRFHLHNELTYEGDGRYATLLPRQEGGIFRVGVDGDISFFVRGDSNGDGRVDLSDAVTVLGYLFLGAPQPSCLDAADADDSGSLFITDAVVILTSLFTSGQRIAPPYPEPGVDPQPDFLKACKR